MAEDNSFQSPTAMAGRRSLPVIASEAKQSSFAAAKQESWIASSQGLLAMTDKAGLAEQSR